MFYHRLDRGAFQGYAHSIFLILRVNECEFRVPKCTLSGEGMISRIPVICISVKTVASVILIHTLLHEEMHRCFHDKIASILRIR